jgi:hypothetical protein
MTEQGLTHHFYGLYCAPHEYQPAPLQPLVHRHPATTGHAPVRASDGFDADLTRLQARKVRARRPSEREHRTPVGGQPSGVFLWSGVRREDFRDSHRQGSKQPRRRTAVPVQTPVRRANANHRTACVGRTMGLRSEESSSVGRASDSSSDGRGFDSLFSTLDKALNRLAVRIRSGCLKHPSSQHPGATPAGGNCRGAPASGR